RPPGDRWVSAPALCAPDTPPPPAAPPFRAAPPPARRLAGEDAADPLPRRLRHGGQRDRAAAAGPAPRRVSGPPAARGAVLDHEVSHARAGELVDAPAPRLDREPTADLRRGFGGLAQFVPPAPRLG